MASSVNLSEAQDDATKNPKQTGVRFHPHFLVDGAKAVAGTHSASDAKRCKRAAESACPDAVVPTTEKFAEPSEP